MQCAGTNDRIRRIRSQHEFGRPECYLCSEKSGQSLLCHGQRRRRAGGKGFERQPERSQATVPPRRQHVHSDLQETQVLRSLPLSRSQANQGPQQMNTTKTTIAIKYPKKYEDAQEIVELLIENECVLIDFQYMLEAQARRCLDFIDGASKVLTGNLQKVGSSMYLLTPINVVVDIEEIGLAHGNQEANFDFDMKRR